MVLPKAAVFLCVVSIVLSKTGAQNGIPEGAATLAFVFDTTGSMYDDLVQVRARASKILAESLKQSVKPLYNYALVPFHDPGKYYSLEIRRFNYYIRLELFASS